MRQKISIFILGFASILLVANLLFSCEKQTVATITEEAATDRGLPPTGTCYVGDPDQEFMCVQIPVVYNNCTSPGSWTPPASVSFTELNTPFAQCLNQPLSGMAINPVGPWTVIGGIPDYMPDGFQCGKDEYNQTGSGDYGCDQWYYTMYHGYGSTETYHSYQDSYSFIVSDIQRRGVAIVGYPSAAECGDASRARIQYVVGRTLHPPGCSSLDGPSASSTVWARRVCLEDL